MTATLAAPTVALRIPAGSRWRHVFAAPLGDSGQPLTVTGWTGRGQIKPSPGSPTVYHAWSSSQIVCSGTTVTVTVPASMSRLWAWTTGHYLIELDDPAAPGEPYRLAGGAVVVDPWPVPGVPSTDPTPGYGLSGYGTSGYGD